MSPSSVIFSGVADDVVSGGIETPTAVIEAAFQEFTERPDIAILLINQHVRPFQPFPLVFIGIRQGAAG